MIVVPLEAPELPCERIELDRYGAAVRGWSATNIDELFHEFGTVRFIDGLLAYKAGRLSYGGFLHHISDSSDAVFIPTLGWEGCRAVLDEMADQLPRFLTRNPGRAGSGAWEEIAPYFPEAFGTKSGDRRP